jgi:hypothetical protein
MVPQQRIDKLERRVAELAEALQALQPSGPRRFWQRLSTK